MSNQPTVYRVPFTGVVKEEEIKRFETDVTTLINAQPSLRLAIDFSKTYHISSRALGLLVAFRKRLAANGGRIVLFGTNPAVEKVLAVTKIDTLFDIVATESDALCILEPGA